MEFDSLLFGLLCAFALAYFYEMKDGVGSGSINWRFWIRDLLFNSDSR